MALSHRDFSENKNYCSSFIQGDFSKINKYMSLFIQRDFSENNNYSTLHAEGLKINKQSLNLHQLSHDILQPKLITLPALQVGPFEFALKNFKTYNSLIIIL